MKVIDKVAPELARLSGKWVLSLALPYLDNLELDEINKAAPYLMIDQCSGMGLFIICDSETECNLLYEMTVGDDGPTSFNSYNGPARIYACTWSPLGEPYDENT